MALRNSLFFILGVLIFTGCSTNVFKPEAIVGNKKMTQSFDKAFFAKHKEGLTYEDGTFVAKHIDKESALVLPEGFAYLSQTHEYIVAANFNGDVYVLNTKDKTSKRYTFEKRILSATYNNGWLAMVDNSNATIIFDTALEKIVFKEEGLEVLAIDKRLANPYFFEELIFFPALDGKVQIYSKPTKELARVMNISTQEHFNNIIFFEIINNKIFAATGSKLYMFANEPKETAMPIRTILVDQDGLVAFGKEGSVVRFDLSLNETARTKLMFAHFLGALPHPMGYVVAEHEGYIIHMAKDLSHYEVYKLGFDAKQFFVSDDAFYFYNGMYKPQ